MIFASPVPTIARTKAFTKDALCPCTEAHQAAVTCVVDDLVTKIGESPASCSPHGHLCLPSIRSQNQSFRSCSRTISKSGVRRFDRVQPHMPCTNSGTAHGPQRCDLLFLASSDRRAQLGLGWREGISLPVASTMTPRPFRSLSSRTGPEPTGLSVGLTAKVPVPRKDTTHRHSALASLSGCPRFRFSG